MTRKRRHLWLGSVVLLAAAGAVLLASPGDSSVRTLGRGLGYTSILLLLLTLTLSSWMMVRKRRIPLSSMVRRDLGIWTAITGGLHALLAWAYSPDIAALRAAGEPG